MGIEHKCNELETRRDKERLQKFIKEDEIVKTSDVVVHKDIIEERI